MKRVLFLLLVCTFLSTAAVNNAEAAEFPWQSWLNLSNSSFGETDPGLKLDTYNELGWMAYRIPGSGAEFVVFTGLILTASSEDDQWWNNKAGLALGLKLQFPFRHGTLSLGIRGEHLEYWGSAAPEPNEQLVVISASWWFGGTFYR